MGFTASIQAGLLRRVHALIMNTENDENLDNICHEKQDSPQQVS